MVRTKFTICKTWKILKDLENDREERAGIYTMS